MISSTPDTRSGSGLAHELRVWANALRLHQWAKNALVFVPTLYTIAKGEKPVLKEQQYPTPVELSAAVPEQLSRMVMECVRYRPAERPGTMQEVIDALELFKGPAK